MGHGVSVSPDVRRCLPAPPVTRIGVGSAAPGTRSICVFCGSAAGASPAYRFAATQLGREIGHRGWRLVYGGASVGLMGEVADAALAAGAEVVGVITPGLVDKEVNHGGLTQLVVEPTMAARKTTMFELSDAVVVLPGGFGTLDELFEAITLNQLGDMAMPVVLVDTDGFWQPLLAAVDALVDAGFVSAANRSLLHVVATPADALAATASPWV